MPESRLSPVPATGRDSPDADVSRNLERELALSAKSGPSALWSACQEAAVRGLR